MTQTPSSGNGATPSDGTTPATGTSTGGATPSGKQIALSIEDAMARIAELERHAQNKTEEAARHGKSLSAAEKELAAYKAAEEAAQAAQMSELEKAQKALADIEAERDEFATEVLQGRVRDAVADLRDKFHFTPSAKTLTKLLLQDFDAIEWDDDTGMPTNIEKLLDILAKAEPDLVKKEAQQQQPGTPNVPAMNPGRSTITPGGNVPGRVPNLFDRDLWKR